MKLGFDPNGPIARGIIAEYATCYDTSELAARLGTTRDTLQVYASKLGIKRTAGRPYRVLPGTAADRALTLIKSLPAGQEATSTEIAQACGIAAKRLVLVLEPATRAGLLKYRFDPKCFRSTALWSLGDGEPTTILPRRSEVQREPREKAPRKPKPTVFKGFNPALKPAPKQAQRRMERALPADAPVVIPANVKITRCPTPVDTRFSADPGHVGPFTLAGIGRNVETGKPWDRTRGGEA